MRDFEEARSPELRMLSLVVSFLMLTTAGRFQEPRGSIGMKRPSQRKQILQSHVHHSCEQDDTRLQERTNDGLTVYMQVVRSLV